VKRLTQEALEFNQNSSNNMNPDSIDCEKGHKIVKLSSNHQISSSNQLEIKSCSIHQYFPLSILCLSCNNANICAECAFLDHEGHHLININKSRNEIQLSLIASKDKVEFSLFCFYFIFDHQNKIIINYQ